MKTFILAAAAVIAMPAIAQTNGTPTPNTPTTNSMPAPPPAQSGDPAMQATPAPMNQATPGQPMAGDSTVPPPPGPPPPPPPPPAAPMTAGMPDGASPPPAPMANYPVCKKGQYDKCREVGSGGGRRRR